MTFLIKSLIALVIIAFMMIGLSLSFSLIEIRDVNMGLDPNEPENGGAKRYGIVGLCWTVACTALITIVFLSHTD